MSGLERMLKRLAWDGETQDDRNVRSKLLSFEAALKNSYQGEWITFKDTKYRCLINPSRLTEEFDKKVISIDYSAGMQEGDIFYWDRTGRYWIIDLQQHTEEAYFRATIERCDYEIEIDGEHYWIYLAGPKQSDMQWRQKHQIMYNEMNYTMKMIVPKNKKMMQYFDRGKIVKVSTSCADGDGGTYTEWHNWQVAVTDKYSSSGTITVFLDEYPDNPDDDLMQPAVPAVRNRREPFIEGPQYVNVYDRNIKFTAIDLFNGEFVVDSNKVEIVESNSSSCLVNILTGKSGKFTLTYKRENEEDVNLEILIKPF